MSPLSKTLMWTVDEDFFFRGNIHKTFMELTILLAAMIPPLLYAATNHIDKHLLEKYFQEGGVGTLMLFSSLFGLIVAPILFLVDPSVLGVGINNILILALVGLINTVLLWAYLQALFTDEPTVVIIFYQLVPVLALILGYFILGETITLLQTVAMGIIIAGAVVMSVAIDEKGHFSFRRRTVLFMLLASVCWASESVLFKFVALEENVWRSLFWEHVVLGTLGILMFVFIRHYRDSFLAAWRANSKFILGMNGANESLYVTGNSIAGFVVVLIPASLTLLMNSLQPMFVFAIGMILAWLFPKLATETINRRTTLQKIFAITLTAIGLFLLGYS